MAVKLQMIFPDGQCITLTEDLIHEDPNQSIGSFVTKLWEAQKERSRKSTEDLLQSIDKMLTGITEKRKHND